MSDEPEMAGEAPDSRAAGWTTPQVVKAALWLFRAQNHLMNNPVRALKLWHNALDAEDRLGWLNRARWMLSDLTPPARGQAMDNAPAYPSRVPGAELFPGGSVYVRVGDADEPIDTMAGSRLAPGFEDLGHVDYDHHGQVYGVEILGAQYVSVDGLGVCDRGGA